MHMNMEVLKRSQPTQLLMECWLLLARYEFKFSFSRLRHTLRAVKLVVSHKIITPYTWLFKGGALWLFTCLCIKEIFLNEENKQINLLTTVTCHCYV